MNLKECRTLFSAANEIHRVVAGEPKGAYEGLDGVFEGLWAALESYPEWPLLILDEIDHIRHDTNYDPSDFFYRLLRGEGKLKRGLNLSVVLISNELLEVDLRLDSRVESAMGGEEVFFQPYDSETLEEIVRPQLERAFQPAALPDGVREHGIRSAARRWGDARKTLRPFRQAGETAVERELDAVTRDCIDANIEATDKEAVTAKLLQLPFNHFFVLTGVIGHTEGGEIKQPVTTSDIVDVVDHSAYPKSVRLGARATRDIVADLETMGLLETWVESRGRDGRVKHIQTTFEPTWVREATDQYLAQSDQIEVTDLVGDD